MNNQRRARRQENKERRKRKKEKAVDGASTPAPAVEMTPEEKAANERSVRNRLAAVKSRERKAAYTHDLEEKVGQTASTARRMVG
eukprot:scaffold7267_cov395-Prasinococcus_capsulatus_cf.AAC.6